MWLSQAEVVRNPLAGEPSDRVHRVKKEAGDEGDWVLISVPPTPPKPV
jgi:hypothetical protein